MIHCGALIVTIEMLRVLILGGTGDAAELATQAAKLPNVEVITSLAGRTRHPSVLAGQVRLGGFGGSAGLAAYLREQQIRLLIDATHPFAAQISWNAAAAATAAGIPRLMLVRPAWEKAAGDNWIEVGSIEAAAQAIPASAKRVFLTIGRQQLAPFAALTETWFLIRSIDPPTSNYTLANSELLLDRRLFSLEQECQLLQQYQIEAIVSRNSGGAATYAKIIAARTLAIPVVMVQRPVMPPGQQVMAVDRAMAWLMNRFN